MALLCFFFTSLSLVCLCETELNVNFFHILAYYAIDKDKFPKLAKQLCC